MGRLFGTDGIRGEANTWPMTPDIALRLGRAIAVRLGSQSGGPGGRPQIVIGKDTRLSGYIFEQALAAGACAMGADVLLCGPLPTPGLAFITHSMRAETGVVITASHNPYWDNGIKLFGADGFKLPDSEEAEIERAVLDDAHARSGARRGGIGRASRLKEAWARYVVFLKSVLPSGMDLDGLKVVIDCANGAAYRVAPAVFSELGANVIEIGCTPDGTNINDGCGSLHTDKLAEAVRMYGADIGVALDGDADRVILADEKGQIVDGDQLMAMSAIRMAREGTLAGRTVVATVMSNLGLEIALRREDIELLRTRVGDRYVVEAMRRGGHNLGGEQSGHILFLDDATTGDGVVAALKTVVVMKREQRPLSELSCVMERVPQVLVNVQVDRKPPLNELPGVTKLIDQVEARLGEEGRVLVRYSGTENKARVMLEGSNEALIHELANDIAARLVNEVSS